MVSRNPGRRSSSSHYSEWMRHVLVIRLDSYLTGTIESQMVGTTRFPLGLVASCEVKVLPMVSLSLGVF